MASMLYTSLFVIMFLAYTLCSPIKRSATDQQATDCQGTECYFDPDYLNPGIVTVKCPENLTEVVLTVLPLIPDMMDRHEQQLKDMTTFMDNMAQTTTVVAQLTSVVAQLLQSQLTLLSERLPLSNPSSSPSLSPSPPASTLSPSSTKPSSTTPSSTSSSSSPTSTPPSPPPRDCQDIADAGSHQSGVYTITPQDGYGSIEVFCEFDSEHIGWIVFQKRFDGSVDFYLGWEEYERGFGSVNGEYWAGLSLINRLTQSGHWQLRIDLEAFDGDTAYAVYDSFSVGDASSNYRLSVGTYSGTAGDSLTFHNDLAFSTKDRDNDQISSRFSAKDFNGAWWHGNGFYSNLNSLYLGPTDHTCCTGIVWFHWKFNQSLKTAEMKIRRIN